MSEGLGIFLVLITIILYAILFVAKRSMKPKKTQQSNVTNLGNYKVTLLAVFWGLIFFGLVMAELSMPTPPFNSPKLNQSPHNLWIYAAHTLVPVAVVSALFFVYFGPNSKIRRAVIEEFWRH